MSTKHRQAAVFGIIVLSLAGVLLWIFANNKGYRLVTPAAAVWNRDAYVLLEIVRSCASDLDFPNELVLRERLQVVGIESFEIYKSSNGFDPRLRSGLILDGDVLVSLDKNNPIVASTRLSPRGRAYPKGHRLVIDNNLDIIIVPY